ncbi:MAG: YicC family protein [Eubacteriales bacterium]|nr:YicC family protein [Eubacteriales bacterium]
MTGYGRGQSAFGGKVITAEIKTVNHRFLDLSLRLPRTMSALEIPLRQRLSAVFARGAVTLTVTHDLGGVQAALVSANLPLAQEYFEAAQQVAHAVNLKAGIKLNTLLSLPEVLNLVPLEEEPEALQTAVNEAVDAACQAALDDREREGEQLKIVLAGHLEELRGSALALRDEAPNQPAHAYEKLVKRLSTLPDIMVEPQRLAQEVALFSDKSDITEEIARLLAHCDQMAQLLDNTGPIGREMDFLAQEMNREANTVCSKSATLPVTRLGLACKAQAEKLREQIQNVE